MELDFVGAHRYTGNASYSIQVAALPTWEKLPFWGL